MQADPDSYRAGYVQANLHARMAIQTVLRRPSTNEETSNALFDVFKLIEKDMSVMYQQQAPNLFTNETEKETPKAKA